MGASGTDVLDFGAFPGKTDTSVVVTGQAAIAAGSLVEAWIRPVATALNDADNHIFAPMKIVAGNIVAGTGFTIYAWCDEPVNEPVDPNANQFFQLQGAGAVTSQSWVVTTPGQNGSASGGKAPRLWGTYNVNWCWN